MGAFEALYGRCIRVTIAFAARRCQTPDQVHDLVAAIWLEVIDAARRYDPSLGKAIPWILGVGANLVRDERRRQAREREALRRLGGQRVLGPDDIERLDEAIAARDLVPRVLAGLDSLSEEERESIDLLLRGMTQSEAATAAGVTSSTYRMRLSRARARLRRTTADDKPDVRLEVTEP